MINVHYRLTNGEIEGHDNSNVPAPMDGCGILRLETAALGCPDPKAYRVDPVKMVLVEKTAEEKLAANAPTPVEVRHLVIVELQRSDHWMLPDRDDVSPAARASWIAYRRSIRDLSKGNPTPGAMIAAFPKRPDGIDVAAALRARLEAR